MERLAGKKKQEHATAGWGTRGNRAEQTRVGNVLNAWAMWHPDYDADLKFHFPSGFMEADLELSASKSPT